MPVLNSRHRRWNIEGGLQVDENSQEVAAVLPASQKVVEDC